MTYYSYDRDTHPGARIGSDWPFSGNGKRKDNTPRKRLPGKEFDERRRVNRTQIRSLRFMAHVIDMGLTIPSQRDKSVRRRQQWPQRRLVRACFNLRRPYPPETYEPLGA